MQANGSGLRRLDRIELGESSGTQMTQIEPRRTARARAGFGAAFTAAVASGWLFSPGVHAQLDEIAAKLAPKQVWVGYDCTDAILKNFVRDRAGRIRGVDVESLGADQLLGSGVAKAAVRWLGPLRSPFLAQLREREVPDFVPYFPFVEMSFLAFWQKSSFLEKKRRFVDSSLFDRFLG